MERTFTSDNRSAVDPPQLPAAQGVTPLSSPRSPQGLRKFRDKYRLSWRDDPATTMIIGWNQVSGKDPRVHYGPADHGQDVQAYDRQHGVDVVYRYRGMVNCFARLASLQPDTPYYFVIADSEGVSERMWFRTAPAEPKPFTFIAGGDSRTNAGPRRAGNRLIAVLRPLFVMHGGDYNGNGEDKDWAQWLDDWQLTRTQDGRMFPLIPAHGNHENADPLMVYRMFDGPRPEMYYALDIGGPMMRVYTLNTELDSDPCLWAAQEAWLKQDMAEHPSPIWTVAMYHKPMRPHSQSKSEGLMQIAAWAQPFHEHGVDLVIESDSHMVKRTYPVRPSEEPGSYESFIRDDVTGTVFIGEGGWAAVQRPADDDKPWTMASGVFHELKWIHAYPDHMEIRQVKFDDVKHLTPNTEADPFRIPDGLHIWTPPTGSVIYLPYLEGVKRRYNSGP